VRRVTASTGKITTFAGTGSTAGFGGDGDFATSTVICNPLDLALDNVRGVLYITQVDSSHCIRAVSLSWGIVSTVAGTGRADYSGDGGPATLASFYDPYMALDSSGNMFIGDMLNNVIRYLHHSTGIIITIAGIDTDGSTGDGGPAALATFNQPGRLALDEAAGRLYVADTQNSVVRVLSMTFPCPAGYWSPTGSTPCTACAANTYSTSSGATSSSSCVSCGTMLTSAVGASACTSTAGNVNIYAGNYVNKAIGDGGPATSARIDFIRAVALDKPRGKMFILGYNELTGTIR
jgi:hypothetical protein